jgi:protein-tyrosine phosphatase
MQFIVDVHSHLVPTEDDGARTIEEGLQLLRLAAAHGTKVIYATPHAHAPWDSYPLTQRRLRLYDKNFPPMRAACAEFGLDLRRGFELFPGAAPSGMELDDLALGDSGFLLVEFPGDWCDGIVEDQLALTFRQAERVEQAGLLPVLAHPERCGEIYRDPSRLEPFVERGWVICLNALSLVGGHLPPATRCAWRLLEEGNVQMVASDAHSDARPPVLDWAFALLAGCFGEDAARPMFDGSPLGLADAPLEASAA